MTQQKKAEAQHADKTKVVNVADLERRLAKLERLAALNGWSGVQD